jgi:hypothetical protein
MGSADEGGPDKSYDQHFQSDGQHPGFAYDTPGAGPSHLDKHTRPRRLEPRAPEQDPDLDLMDDEPLPEGPTLADTCPWLEGLSARAILEQELQAKMARQGGE